MTLRADLTPYVVDASIVIQYLIADTFTGPTDALFSQVGQSVSLVLPEFGFLECANVLWKQAAFYGLPAQQAQKLLTDLLALPLTVIAASDLLRRGLQIGLDHQLAIYDSVYIALAERFGYPLITADARQEQAARALGIVIKPVTDFLPES